MNQFLASGMLLLGSFYLFFTPSIGIVCLFILGGGRRGLGGCLVVPDFENFLQFLGKADQA